MTEYENGPFVVGDYKHNQIEFFHHSHEQWYVARPYPYGSRIFGYAVVSRPGQVFLFGGCGDWLRKLVTVFKKDEWFIKGYLAQPRMNFMTITYGTDALIFGGITKNKTNRSVYHFLFQISLSLLLKRCSGLDFEHKPYFLVEQFCDFNKK